MRLCAVRWQSGWTQSIRKSDAFRTILAADDSSGVLEALASLFGPLSYQVVYAPNGKGALTLARAVRPDLVITDVMLRASSGIGFVRELRQDADLGRTPVILWSAVYSPHQINGLANGCEPFTARNKFEDLDGFVSVVNEMLGLGKIARQPQGMPCSQIR